MIVEQDLEVERWFVREPFNPASPQQIIDYMRHTGQIPAGLRLSDGSFLKSRKGAQPSTDEQTLERLAKKDNFYGLILKYRKLAKMESTYVSSLLNLIDQDGRIHPKFLHNPSTWRLSCVEPNWQNVPDAEEEDSLERRFRRCVVAKPGCQLIEADFAAIEAVQTGWFANDPNYVRLARMGIHSYLVSHRVNEPADLTWDDEKLAAHLRYIKKKYKDGEVYYAFKRTVHLTNYGGSPHMMVKVDPKVFPTVAKATEFQNFYLKLVPALGPWQRRVRQQAAQQNFLGGADHPYHFKHWFWDVMKVNGDGTSVPGSDWNRVVAYYPQSTAAGNLFDVCLHLMDPSSQYYVGNLFYGETPLRAFIHDSILAEVPNDKVDEFKHKLHGAMTEPIYVQPLPWNPAEFLKIEADVKMGVNWGEMR